MEQFIFHLVHVAAWVFGVLFLFAIIGVIAVIRWIFNLVTRTERAVESGARDVENFVTKR